MKDTEMAARQKHPIMTPDEERYMAFEGVLQWARAVITQAERTSDAQKRQMKNLRSSTSAERRLAILELQTECHFFAIAAFKLIEFRKWVRELDLLKNVNFDDVDMFSGSDIRDLRNMREHVVDYFQGGGFNPDRWNVETPEYKADASSIMDTKIGGRLDWIAFGAAAARLLPQLLAEPIPFSSMPTLSNPQ